MGFDADTPTVAGVTLLRSAIQSPDYVPGTSGWTINQNGSVEFTNGIFRGTINAGAGAVVIDSLGIVITSLNRILSMTAGGYSMVENPPTGSQIQITTSPGFGGVLFAWPQNSAVPGVTFFPGSVYGSRDEAAVTPVTTQPYLKMRSPFVNPAQHASTIQAYGQSSASATDDSFIFTQAQQLTYVTTSNATPGDGGMGWVAGDMTVANLAGVVGSAQVTQLTALAYGTPGFVQPTFAAGRAYKVEVCGNVQTTAVGAAPVIEVRKNTNVGQRFGSWRIGPTVAGFPYGFSGHCIFTVGAANVTATGIVLTLGGAAAQTVQIIASNDNPTTINIYDVGLARDFPLAPTIV